ncbi:hypothetical protein KIN20_038365 [Parelaphostrongylus tenuis]|uniref:Helicase ATP-binding domain-containing protein n=1 Tax=Parelaphostrongylus tenuis TaxID=148309 RepID=A0AAD5WMI0_PARTN|nr:hypothetical protein KIN20_038365 [Parelaphostrongylus tenuis]
MGSRDQLCIHEWVCKQSDARVKASVCRGMISRRTCQYYNKWDRTPVDTLNEIFRESGAVPDIEDMITIGRKHGICPFFRCRQMQEMAELVLLPYNYIIDPQLRKLHKIDLAGSVVIFDEAHNLENICEDVVSVEISSVHISLAIQELKDAIECLQNEIEEKRIEMDQSSLPFGSRPLDAEKQKQPPFQINDAAILLAMLFDLEVKVEEIFNDETGRNLEGFPGKVFPGDRLFETFESVGISFDKAEVFSKVLSDISEYSQQGTESNPSLAERGKNLELLSNFISVAYLSLSKEAALAMGKNKVNGNIDLKCQKISLDSRKIARHFKLYVVKEEGTASKPSSTVMKFWCFTSSIAMKALKMNGVRTVIVTSGTLSPLPNFVRNIGLDFGSTLENQHAAKSDQIITAVLSKSPFTGRVLNGSFQNRHTNTYAVGIAESIISIAKTVPQGILVFFASYNLMDHLISKFKELKDSNQKFSSKSYWDQMTEAKLVVVEPKQKVSEGIDFSDKCSRAVCIIGVPYPPLMDVRICLKRLYLNEIKAEDKMNQSADDWYVTEGYRAVNQALGRVLRHVNDFGVVTLLDERFGKINKEYFPSWMRASIKVFDKGSEFLSSTTDFFAKRKLEIRKTITPLVSPAKKRSGPSCRSRSRATAIPSGDVQKECVLDYDLYARPLPCSLERAPTNVSTKKESSSVTSLLSICADDVASKSEPFTNVNNFEIRDELESPSTSESILQSSRKRLKLTRASVDGHHVCSERQREIDVFSLPRGYREATLVDVKQYLNTLTNIGKKDQVAAIVMKFAMKEHTFEEMLSRLENELLPDYPEAFLGAYCIIDKKENKQRILQRALSLHLKL